MKTQNLKLFFAVILLFVFASARAQVPFKLTAANQQTSGTSVEFDIFLQATTPEPLYLSPSDFVLNFNHANFTDPVLTYINNSSVLLNANGNPTTAYNEVIALKIVDNQLVIIVNEISFTNQTEFNTRAAKIDNTPLTHKLGRFSVSNVTNAAGTFGLQWVQPKTIIQSYESTKWAVLNCSSIGTYEVIDDAPLPVTLASFTASNVNKRDIKLSWTTSTEINNSGFEIERKLSDGNWQKVGFQNGSGTTNTPVSYNFTDSKLNTGKYNYRLKQIDNNGNFHYYDLSSAVEVGIPTKYDLSQNYPNPFNPVTKIDFDLPKDSRVNIVVYDILGREMKSIVNEFRKAGYYTVTFDASALSSGTYFYRLLTDGDNNIITKKLTLVK
ncbi:MAG: T9SS type A sorting domain-containing protein [Ignavibacteria bacterium]